MAAELFPAATIYALEIVPDTAAVLRSRVGQHDRIKSYNLGLAAHTGTLPVRYYQPASRHATYIDFPRSWTGEWIDCPVMRGDEFLAQEAIREIDFLKLDVEGAEAEALRGARRILVEHRPIVVCELHGDAARRQVLELLEGYRVDDLETPTRIVALKPC